MPSVLLCSECDYIDWSKLILFNLEACLLFVNLIWVKVLTKYQNMLFF